jgi:hypothetical protein
VALKNKSIVDITLKSVAVNYHIKARVFFSGLVCLMRENIDLFYYSVHNCTFRRAVASRLMIEGRLSLGAPKV